MPSMCEFVVCFDLDDTLYKERSFVLSAYKEVSLFMSQYSNVPSVVIFKSLVAAFYNGNPAFQVVIKKFNLNISVQTCLDIYRNHKPSLSLSAETESVLEFLKSQGCVLGLITDGRTVSQRNKIEALELYRYFQRENILISEQFGSEKPDVRNFLYFVNKYPQSRFVYVGDNIGKDFLAPNKLEWNSICLLNNGENIHKQNFNVKNEYCPKFIINNLLELKTMIL
jgi:putative hydrolase of the HAD superfamily